MAMKLSRMIGGIDTRTTGDAGLEVLARALLANAYEADQLTGSRHVNVNELREICRRVQAALSTPPASPASWAASRLAEGTQTEPPLMTWMTTDDPVRRDAAYLRMYAEHARNGTDLTWDIPNTRARTLSDIANRMESRLAEGTRVKCDGNHGGPRCADPECWNDTPPASPATTSTQIWDTHRPGCICGACLPGRIDD